jgi:hypothetical protein
MIESGVAVRIPIDLWLPHLYILCELLIHTFRNAIFTG